MKKKKKDQKMESRALIDGCLCLFVYMCLLEKHMSICHHEDYVSYLSIWKCVHSVSYVIHNVTSSTFDSGNSVVTINVYFIHACFLYPLLKRTENVHP